MRGMLRRFVDSPAPWFIALCVCIWLGVRYWHDAVTEGFTVLRSVKAGLVTAIGLGWVLRAMFPGKDQ